jgi:hypothetical protein
MTTWYLCLSAYEGDVPRTWCNRIGEHFAHYSIEGAVALERSKHSNCLHCVSVFETHSFGDAGTARLLYAQLRAFISIALGTHVKFRMKQLAADQNYMFMLRYVQNNRTRLHYALRSNLVSDEDLAEARFAYQSWYLLSNQTAKRNDYYYYQIKQHAILSVCRSS